MSRSDVHPDERRIVIVGAGASGMATALALSTRGCRDVTVIEREHVATGSSAVSAGIVTRQYTEPLDVALRVEAYRAIERLVDDHDLTFRRNGFLRLAHDDATIAEFELGAARQRELGVDDAVVLDRDEVARLVPEMRCDDLTGGLYGPTDGYLDGQQLTMLYAELAEARGVRTLVRTQLTGHARDADGSHRLQTTRGALSCDLIVNAAGAWAPAAAELLGTSLPVVAERHQACIMHLAEPLGRELTAIMDYVPGSGSDGLYLRPEGERQLLVGTHSNESQLSDADPDAYYRGVDAAFVDALLPALVDRMPGFAEVGLEGGWAGLYPVSADGRFIIGPCGEDPTIMAAAGVGGVGVYMSPVVGRIAADWVLDGVDGRADGEEHRRFDPRRFAA